MNINRDTKPQLVEMSILIVLTRISDTHSTGRQISLVNDNSLIRCKIRYLELAIELSMTIVIFEYLINSPFFVPTQNIKLNLINSIFYIRTIIFLYSNNYDSADFFKWAKQKIIVQEHVH